MLSAWKMLVAITTLCAHRAALLALNGVYKLAFPRESGSPGDFQAAITAGSLVSCLRNLHTKSLDGVEDFVG